MPQVKKKHFGVLLCSTLVYITGKRPRACLSFSAIWRKKRTVETFPSRDITTEQRSIRLFVVKHNLVKSFSWFLISSVATGTALGGPSPLHLLFSVGSMVCEKPCSCPHLPSQVHGQAGRTYTFRLAPSPESRMIAWAIMPTQGPLLFWTSVNTQDSLL